MFGELGWGGGDATKVLGFVVTAALVVAAGILGFDVIMRLQTWITLATIVLTIGFIALTLDEVDWTTVSDAPSGSTQAFIGALALVATGFGVGWANTAADYSRYLPRLSSGRGVFGWTTIGGAAAPIVLTVFGIMLALSSSELSDAISADPIGALTTLLPTWYLLPFIVVAVLGLVGGAVLDIYSSGLALLTLGLKVKRPVAAAIDGVIMVHRRDLRRVHRRRLPGAVPGLPHHRRRADRGLGRRVRRRPVPAAPAVRRRRALRPARPLRLGAAGRPSSSSWSAPSWAGGWSPTAWPTG